ncbi:MAG: CTP synthase [bacterium]|nr:CTP synthase [bacterium]
MGKLVFVTGGVVSSLGKGITTAALGYLLRARGLGVTAMKLDPYLNVDAGTMSPFQHGEVFVTVDGGEADLDLGHYERFLDRDLTRRHCVTSGQVYGDLLARERQGDYLGRTVQVIPHLTDEIGRRVHEVARAPEVDVTLVEVGGTVGDIESQPFLEAIRQIEWEVGPGNAVHVHVTLVPYLSAAGELKTKPTQHSVRELRAIGIQPDFIVCRSERALTAEARAKIAQFGNVRPEAVIANPDVATIYQVPLVLEEEGLAARVASRLGLDGSCPDLERWRRMVDSMLNPAGRVRIALVGKYVALPDAYLSIVEALGHAGAELGVGVEIDWVDSEADGGDRLARAHGVLVPGGFGLRGVEGKIGAVRHARESGTPFLGICLGLQCAVVEAARHQAGLTGAHSTEFEPDTPHPVIDLLPGQRGVEAKGGTMRLGAYPCRLAPGTGAARAYGRDLVQERHRHRYEVNPAYVDLLERHGLRAAGRWPVGDLVELVERDDHPWFVATQFHPEFQSRPGRPHPLFRGLVAAARERAAGSGG